MQLAIEYQWRTHLPSYHNSLPPLATQQAIVAEIEAEQALVAANRELIARFEKKIQATLARVWGEEATRRPRRREPWKKPPNSRNYLPLSFKTRRSRNTSSFCGTPSRPTTRTTSTSSPSSPITCLR